MTNYGIASSDAYTQPARSPPAPEAIVTIDTGFALLPASLLAIYTD